MLAAARVVFSWLAQDTTLLQPMLNRVLESLLRLACQEESLLPLLVPGLCHLTAEDQSRQLVLQSPMLPCLYRYLTVANPGSREATCGVFLNVVVLEQELVSSSPAPFPDLLLHCVERVTTESDPPVLKANLVVLGLFLIHLKVRPPPGRTVDVGSFVRQAARFFGTMPVGSEGDAEELHELRSLGQQVLCELQDSNLPS